MSVREFYAKLFRKNQEKHKTIEDYIKKNHYRRFLKLHIMSC